MAKHFDIIVINPAVSTDRRESVKSQMEKFNVDYEIFDAFDPRRMPADDLELKRSLHQPFNGMSSGQFGVSLSHYYSVKNWLEKKKSDFLIVFEDDILVTEKITEILNAQEQLHALPFDVLKLGGHISRRGRIAMKIGRVIKSDVVYPFNPSMNSVAYILKRSGAKKFLKHMEKFTTNVDVKLFKEIKFGFVVLEISPFCFRETGVPSTILPTIEFISPKPKKTFMLRATNDLHHFARALRNIAHYLLSVRSVGSIVRIK